MASLVDQSLDDGLASDLASASLALARRFAAGGTLWSVAPAWEQHAQHIAVEFVHPVIVGKKALPAVALTGRDLLDSARVSVRAGDVLVAVAGAADRDVCAVMRRAPAWGVATLWIGSGARPPAAAADHVLWLADPDPLVPATGRFVLLYHLLWELTHVCFEHPGLLTADRGADAGEVCVTCSDEGRLAEALAPSAGGVAWVRTAAGEEAVTTVLVEPVEAGDLLLVHAGSAIAKVAETGADGGGP